MLLIVTVYLKYHWLGLDVLNEGPSNGGCYVLDMVEVERSSLAIVFQGFRGEGFIMTIYKTKNIIFSIFEDEYLQFHT